MAAYSTTSKASEVIERISYLLEQATPDLAPSVLWARHTDTSCHVQDVTDPARFRLFTVRKVSAAYGLMTWGQAKASFDFGIKISVGYPAADYYPEADDEIVDGYRYLTEDLKLSDFEQIVRLLEADAPWEAIDGDHPAISDVQIALLRGATDEYEGRIRSITYGVQLVRTY